MKFQSGQQIITGIIKQLSFLGRSYQISRILDIRAFKFNFICDYELIFDVRRRTPNVENQLQLPASLKKEAAKAISSRA